MSPNDTPVKTMENYILSYNIQNWHMNWPRCLLSPLQGKDPLMRGDETNTTTPRMYIASILVLNKKREGICREVDVVVDAVNNVVIVEHGIAHHPFLFFSTISSPIVVDLGSHGLIWSNGIWTPGSRRFEGNRMPPLGVFLLPTQRMYQEKGEILQSYWKFICIVWFPQDGCHLMIPVPFGLLVRASFLLKAFWWGLRILLFQFVVAQSEKCKACKGM